MSAIGKYQEFDPLAPEEYAALERSILEHGVQVPIVLDEHGNPIDGHHRLAICKKHGITDYPTTVKAGLSDSEKMDMAQSLNMARRSLTREQRQKQIRSRLSRNPDHSDRMIAQALGVDHKTVGRIRGELVTGGEIPQQTVKLGLNGMLYKTHATPKTASSAGGEIPQRQTTLAICRSEHTSLANILTDVNRRAGELAERSPLLYRKLESLRRHLASAEKIISESKPEDGQ